MRIVSGRWAGRSLVSPGRRVRPTAESVRAAWLESLGDTVRGARVLDLFAGSGALGLEALSRGAASVDFVENGAAALHSLKANVAALRATKKTRIFKRDVLPWVQALASDAYDIAFVDAPYGSRKLDRVLETWLKAGFARTLGVESALDHPLPPGGRTVFNGEGTSEKSTRVTLFFKREKS